MFGVRRSSESLATLALASAGCLWGISFLFGKWAFEELNPFEVTLMRFVVSSLVLLPYVFLRGVFPRKEDLPAFVLVGFLAVPATFLIQFWGLSMTSASTAAMIIGCVPPLVAFAAFVFLGEKLKTAGWLALAASSIGVSLLVSNPSGDDDWRGNLLVGISLLSVVGWVLLGRSLGRRYNPLDFTAWVLIFGTAVLVPFTLAYDGMPALLTITPRTWASILMLGIGCSAASYTLWNWGVSRVPASRAGVFINLEPLVGAVLGILILHEAWGITTLIGGLLIVCASVVISSLK